MEDHVIEKDQWRVRSLFGRFLFGRASGKFAIFAQNLTWVKKIKKNRDKSAESNELIFRFFRLHFRVENAV